MCSAAVHGVGSLEKLLQAAAAVAREEIFRRQGGEICSIMYDDTEHLSPTDRPLLRLARVLQPDAGVPRPLRPLRVPLRGRHRQQQQHQLRGVHLQGGRFVLSRSTPLEIGLKLHYQVR